MDNEKAEGWGDGSEAKALARQAGDLNPYPRTHIKSGYGSVCLEP